MRQRREALGLTVREVALRVGLRASSASYLSQLESGAKTPHPGLASRLADALLDDRRIYLAWAATGRRSDPVATARAVQLLAGALGHPAYAGLVAERGPRPEPPREPGADEVTVATTGAEPRDLVRARPIPAPGEDRSDAPAGELAEFPATPPPGAAPQARILVPEIAEGADPGDGARSSPEIREVHRVSADSLAGIEPPVRPFAFRLSSAGARRVGDVLAAGDLAIVTRGVWPLERLAPYAVRLSGHLVLSRALWNGRQLLLLPGRDESDFIVLDAPDRAALERLIAGKVVARVRGGE
jgi:transcriptional regulator with XRE-family HTH domain